MDLKQPLIVLSIVAAIVAPYYSFAQFKIGNNPTTISSNTNLEVEATDGTHFTVKKASGFVGIGTIRPNVKLNVLGGNVSVANTTDSENSFDEGIRASVAIGTRNTVKSWYSMLIGQNNLSEGRSSLVIGANNVVGNKAINALVYGNLSEAIGANSFSGGMSCRAEGDNSVALGKESWAAGSNSIVLGLRSTAKGINSNAQGYQCMAEGNNSIAFGSQGIASFDGSAVIADGSDSFLFANGSNSMSMRYAGGYFLFSNAAMSTGVKLNANATSWSSESDVRVTQNVSEINYGLATVLKLTPKKFQYKKSNDKYILGFIAQDVQKLVPEVVDVPSNSEQFLSIHYSELIPVLTKAIQEQQTQIETLRHDLSEITVTMQKIAALRNGLEEGLVSLREAK